MTFKYKFILFFYCYWFELSSSLRSCPLLDSQKTRIRKLNTAMTHYLVIVTEILKFINIFQLKITWSSIFILKQWIISC